MSEALATTNGTRPPLTDIRVLDLTSVLMGPWACQILGDMGADVIKVEPLGGDGTRGVGPSVTPGMGPFFLNSNRNKRSLALDLKHPDGYAAFLELVKTADLLVYNIRPQAMHRLKLDYETLRALNPRLIYVGAFGFSQDGPYAAKPAYDDLIQGLVALPYLTAIAGGGTPRYLPVTIIDRAVALHTVIAAMGALFERSMSGVGQSVAVPMFETMAQFVLGDHLHGHTFRPPLGPMGYDRLLVKERRPYQTSDGHICVLVYTDRHWQSFGELIDRPELQKSDPRLKSITTRTHHIQDLYALVAEAMLTRTTGEWMEQLSAADIPCNPMHTLESLLEDPHLDATGFFATAQHPSEGEILSMLPVGNWSRTPSTVRRQAPRLGEHSLEILRDAGIDEGRIAHLLDQKVMRQAEQAPGPARSGDGL